MIGASYPLYFGGLALRHFIDPQLAQQFATGTAILVNPITVYWIFHGYRARDAA